MSNAGSDRGSVAASPIPPPTARSTARTLIQAAALAATLVPLGSVAAESATIICVAGGGGCSGFGGSYSGGLETEQNNIWKFFTGSDLIYTFAITGTPIGDFELDVNDFVTTQGGLLEGGDLDAFPGYTCIPTFDDTSGQCGLFDVSESLGTAAWVDGYLVEIIWFATNSSGQPLDDGFNTILQAMNAPNGDGTTFTNQLGDINYDPSPTPTDPAISGRGSGFSRFGAFRNEADAAVVPEPASLVMLGTGLVGLAYRARRRRRR